MSSLLYKRTGQLGLADSCFNWECVPGTGPDVPGWMSPAYGGWFSGDPVAIRFSPDPVVDGGGIIPAGPVQPVSPQTAVPAVTTAPATTLPAANDAAPSIWDTTVPVESFYWIAGGIAALVLFSVLKS